MDRKISDILFEVGAELRYIDLAIWQGGYLRDFPKSYSDGYRQALI